MNAERYRVFTRTWWTPNPEWPRGLEPHAGRRYYKGHPKRATLEQAQSYCKVWNACHNPGRLSRKAEFESY